MIVSHRNLVLTAALAILVSIEFAGITVYYAAIRENKFLVQLTRHKIMLIENIMTSTAAFTDLALAGSLVFLLRRWRSGFAQTDSMVQRIIAYTVSTSLVTFLVACLAIISLLAWPKTFVFIGCAHLISQCEWFTLHKEPVFSLLTIQSLQAMSIACSFREFPQFLRTS